MKHNLLFLIPVIFFSCNGPGSGTKMPDSIGAISTKDAVKAVKADETLKSIIAENIHNQPVIDTVFLGFTFSMTKKQALLHYNQLVKEKKLIFNPKNQFDEYPMAFEMVKANAAIAPEFNDGKLYKLSLVIQPADDMATAQTIYYQAATAYMQKYRGYKLFQEADLAEPNAKHMHWIKNNLHIELNKNSGGCVVSYTNMLAKEQVDKTNSAAADSAKAQTKKDI